MQTLILNRGMTMRYLTLILILGTLQGCYTITHEQAKLENAEGEIRYCYLDVCRNCVTSGPAIAEYNRCLNDAGAAGFMRE